jgi:hypothetical protein
VERNLFDVHLNEILSFVLKVLLTNDLCREILSFAQLLVVPGSVNWLQHC